MRKIVNISTLVLALLWVFAPESATYAMQEIAASERADDFRETEELRISTSSINVAKATFTAVRTVCQPPFDKSTITLYTPAPVLFQFLYLRLRVLRN